MTEDDTIPTSDQSLLRALQAEAMRPPAGVEAWGAATSRGSVRTRNEDAWGHLGSHVFIAADGMGGHPGGDLASKVAVNGLTSSLRTRGLDDWNDVIRRLNHQVRAAAAARGYARAGTALAAAVVDGAVTTIVHVGDCRAYRLHRGELIRLTSDHTIDSELRAAGLDRDERRRRGLPLQALTRYLGGPDEHCVPDVNTFVPASGDRMVLLTDGVFRQIAPRLLARILSADDPSSCARALIAAADDAGGRDNATAVVLDYRARP